jgi:hypothetical protein
MDRVSPRRIAKGVLIGGAIGIGIIWLALQPDVEVQNILIGGFLIFFYLGPAFTAHRRQHHNRAAITVLNVFLGWTVLGWIIALVWAYTATNGNANTDSVTIAESGRPPRGGVD